MSVAGKSILVRLAGWVALVGGSVAVALVLFEFMIQQLRKDGVAMRVAPSDYGAFDEDLGVRYRPGTAISYAYLDSEGHVLECLPDISITNVDGFRGVDTWLDYEQADQRIIVSGDSFSHWNIGGLTLADYARKDLEKRGYAASILNVAGGTFGLEHMLVHTASAVESNADLKPDLVAVQFIRDDITRGWWFVDTVTDQAGRARARLGKTVECLAADSGCGSDEYLIESRATQAWCESRRGLEVADDVSADLVDTYRDIRGFFVYVPRILARLGIVDSQATSVIPRVTSVEQANTARLQKAIRTLKSSGVRIVFVYLPTAEEIKSQQIFTFTEIENEVLRFYEDLLGVPVAYPNSYLAFEGVTEFAVSPVDSHPSRQLQQAYGRYLATVFEEFLPR